MEAQGYQVQDNILFQDNKSAILLEKNGKALSSKHTKHINIWYFFITDRVDKGDISLVWCLTGDMIGDFIQIATIYNSCIRQKVFQVLKTSSTMDFSWS
jgi:hypothetical protein